MKTELYAMRIDINDVTDTMYIDLNKTTYKKMLERIKGQIESADQDEHYSHIGAERTVHDGKDIKVYAISMMLDCTCTEFCKAICEDGYKFKDGMNFNKLMGVTK